MLDVVRVGERHWEARAAARVCGTIVTLEVVFECDEMPRIAVDVDTDARPARLVLRHRDDPSIVLASRQLGLTERAPSFSMSAEPAPSTAMT